MEFKVMYFLGVQVTFGINGNSITIQSGKLLSSQILIQMMYFYFQFSSTNNGEIVDYISLNGDTIVGTKDVIENRVFIGIFTVGNNYTINVNSRNKNLDYQTLITFTEVS